MSDNSEHLERLEAQHKQSPENTGCIWRHARGYRDEDFPGCSYRFNAHAYSKQNETGIYDIPNKRVSQADVAQHAGMLPSEGGWPGRTKKLRPLLNDSWHLGNAPNFTHELIPYWHTTHHCIACGEMTESFETDEVEIILASRWNINQMPNVIILPKQPQIATLMKLPTHVPPDGPQCHPNYSLQLQTGLERLKARMAANARSNRGHKLVTKDANRLKQSLENVSSQLRNLLFDEGERAPGISVDALDLSRINWEPVS